MANVIELVRPETAFDPETVAVLAAAFNEAWDRLWASGSECARPAYARAMQEVVARRIIEMAQHRLRSHTHKGDSVFWRTVIQTSQGWRFGWHGLI